MLSDHPAAPCLAVRDLDAARRFYEDVLGFRRQELPGSGDDDLTGIFYGTANGGLLVYPSSFAGTNRATAVSFQVDDAAFDAEVAALRSRGIELQTFDVPSGTWEDGVLREGPMRSSWFADPDGNVLNVAAVGTPPAA
jgi:catechol 2,3-dioxygenase-like lactoylglutathione lyase family enzyme